MKPQNPYIGPRAFQDGETLYGRDREVSKLLNLLIAERIVLLYSPSGAGKTSLIQAALMPALREEGFRVFPIIRVGMESPPDRDLPTATNRYLLSTLLSLEEGLPPEQQTPLAELAAIDFPTYLERRLAGKNDVDGDVLIFDQFEEILTVDPTGQATKAEFFAQLGQALRPRNRWALFAMREEYPAGLDPYLRPIPTRFSTTFRLELLGVKAAREAMQEPARQASVPFTNTATAKLIDDLRRVQVQQPDGSMTYCPGLYVEPVQLQVVCYRLWNHLPQGAAAIEEAHIQEAGDVNAALAGYYADRVRAAAEQTGIRERRIREWFHTHLITEQGIRGQVLRGQNQSQGLDNRAIIPVVDAHLVRAEHRRGATWYELAHDRLIEPIKTNNARWFQENLSPLQRQADLWQNQGRTGSLLLYDEALEEAELWAAEHERELTPLEYDFLKACQEARTITEARQTLAQAERDRRKNRFIQGLALVAILISVVAVYFFLQAWANEKEALKQKELAEENYKQAKVNELGYLSAKLRDKGDYTQAIRVAQAAYEIAPEQVPPTVNEALSDSYNNVVMNKESFFYQHVLYHGDNVNSAVYSPDGHTILTASDDGTAKIWSADGTLMTTLQHGSSVLKAVFSGDGSRIVTMGDDTLLKLWSTDGTLIKDLQGHECDESGDHCKVNHVAFSPDGERMVSVGDDSSVILWDKDGNLVHREAEAQEPFIHRVHFSPDGLRFVTASMGGDSSSVKLWDGYTGEKLADIAWEERFQHRAKVDSGFVEALFSADGQHIITASAASGIRIFDLQENLPNRTFEKPKADIRVLVPTPDGKGIASGAKDGEIIEWNEDGTIRSQFSAHDGAITQLTYSPDGRFLLSASADRSVKLWDEHRHLLNNCRGHKAAVNSAQLSPDHSAIVTASSDSSARIWAVQGISPSVIPYKEGIVVARFLPDEQRVLIGISEPNVVLWDLNTASVIREYGPYGSDRYRNRRLYSLDLSPDGTRFVVTCTDYLIRIQDVETGAVIKSWDGGHRGSCTPTAWCGAKNAVYSPDGKMIATADFDGYVAIWDADGNPIRRFEAHKDAAIYGLAFSPDSQYLLTGANDRTIKLWTIEGEWRRTFADHTASVNWVAFSPDGKWIASASFDYTARLRDTAGEHPPIILTGHSTLVNSIAFSPSGKYLITASDDYTAKIWNLQGHLLWTLNGHRGAVRAAFFSPSGDSMLTASLDKKARIWLDPQAIYTWVTNADIYRLTDEDRQELGLPQPQ